MKNPNFQENMTPEVKAKLDAWFGEGGYEALIIWKEYGEGGAYFAVIQTGEGAAAKIHMARLFKIGDKMEISIDEQKEVA